MTNHITFMGYNLGEIIEITDEQAAEAHARGDTQLLIQSQIRLAIRVATRASRIGPYKDPLVLLSVALEAMCLNIHTFDPARGRFLSWSWRVMKTAIRAFVTRECKKHGNVQDWIDEVVESKLDCDYQDDLNTMLKVISQLEPKDQLVLEAYRTGVPNEQLAKQFGITASAVCAFRRSAIGRARKILMEAGYD